MDGPDSIDTATPPSETSPRSPRLPLELLLEVFFFADRSTLCTLHFNSLTFFELIAPSYYKTAHLTDLLLLRHLLPILTSRPLGQFIGLDPHLAFDAVRTLHLTLPKRSSSEKQVFPSFSLPNLDHLYIHHSEEYVLQPLLSLTSCVHLLSNINPHSVTFSLSTLALPNDFRMCILMDTHTNTFTSHWTRLEESIFKGGSLHEPYPSDPQCGDLDPPTGVPVMLGLDREWFGDQSFFALDPPRVTHDLRPTSLDGMEYIEWPECMMPIEILLDQALDWDDVTAVVLVASERQFLDGQT